MIGFNIGVNTVKFMHFCKKDLYSTPENLANKVIINKKKPREISTIIAWRLEQGFCVIGRGFISVNRHCQLHDPKGSEVFLYVIRRGYICQIVQGAFFFENRFTSYFQ